MKFLRMDDVIIPVDNIAHIRATKPDNGLGNVEVATKNGIFHLFPRDDPAAEVDRLWEVIMSINDG